MIKKYLLIPAALMLLASCSNDTDIKTETSTTKEAPVPIRLGSSMQVITRSNSQTIQTGDPSTSTPGYLTNGKKAGVYIYYAGEQESKAMGSGTYGYKNLEYTVNGTTGAMNYPTGNQPYCPESKTQNIDIYVYSPFISGTAELNTLTAVSFNTQQDQTSEDNYIASDFVWGKKAGVTNSDAASTINVPLDHKCSKINVNIAGGTGVALSSLLGASITLADVNHAGSINLTTGAVSEATTPSTNTLTFTTATAAPTGKFASDNTIDCYTASAVIIPQNISGKNLTIELSNGSTYKYALTQNFAAGTAYTYDITVNAAGLTLTTTLSNWTAGGTTPGTAE